MKITRVEQHVIKRGHPMWKIIDQNCFYSKNLYNLAMYTIRQGFISNKKWIHYNVLDKMLQLKEEFGEGYQLEDCGLVCDDCYNKMFK